jgi:mono/diheme cytochrome c family protein
METSAQAGDPQAGKALWEAPGVECHECHGVKGEGALGPDLAGRKLTLAQFIHAVRKPWGIMPAFVESQMSDRELADLHAYFSSLPTVAEPGPWKVQVRPDSPRGLQMATTAGCVQCHNPNFNNGRGVMGALNADFAWFRAVVYTHTTALPPTRVMLGEPPLERITMGNFSPIRLPESSLQEIWNYISGLGLRPRMRGTLTAGVAAANGVTHTLEVRNTGVANRGLTAEDLTITLIVPAGASVVAATGAGYEGARRDEQANADVAVWRVPRMAPGDRQTYTITLSRTGTAAGSLRGRINWTKPVVKSGPMDVENIPPAPASRP